jgi:hypothetical protein
MALPSPPRGRAWRIALFVIAVLAIAEVAYLVVRTLKPAAGSAPSATLAVDSTPVGADVYIDGQKRGNTPLKIDLTAGTHALEIRSGGSSHTRSVT